MSSVVISGDTSGSVTLQAPAVSGSTILTLPATSGTIVTSASGTAATATNLAGGSNGTIPYQSASGTTQMLAVGTSGQVLQTNGVGAPSWVTSSPSAMTLLATGTASNSATLDFTGISSTYDLYFIEIVEIVGASASSLRMLTSSNNGSNYDASGYAYQSLGYVHNNLTWTTDGDSAATYLTIWNNNCNNISATASYSGLSANAYLFSPASSAYTKFYATAMWFSSSTASSYAQISGSRMSISPVNAIRFLMASGNIASGKIRLYGIANS